MVPPDSELEHIKVKLQENERLMREAAIRYEDLVAAKETLTTDLQACKLARKAARENQCGKTAQNEKQ
jgi:hypothetical protein